MRSRLIEVLCAAVFLFIFVTASHAQSDMGKVPVEWQTVAEKTAYKKTSTYDETVAYCKKLINMILFARSSSLTKD